ncbi:MAG: response regulator, partial [Steroidobacteraceae bacterium]
PLRGNSTRFRHATCLDYPLGIQERPKELVELQGGTITAESEGEGRGAVFTVFLPLEKRLAAAPRESSVAGEPGALRGAHVLLVEDESGARGAAQLLLEQHGARVRSVGSARQAREVMTTQRPDVLIADIGMPDEDGYVFISSIRRAEQEQRVRRVPAVALTAFARAEDRERALAAGFDEHLSKPVDPDGLIDTLSRLIRDEPAGAGSEES